MPVDMNCDFVDSNFSCTLNIDFLLRFRKMSLKCVICGKEEYSLLRANHKELGIIKLCVECWSGEQSKNKLLPLEGGCGCCR